MLISFRAGAPRRGNLLKLTVILAVAGLLPACKPNGSGSILGRISSVDPAALSTSYVTDFSPFEAAAAALRDANPRYLFQKFSWSPSAGSSKVYDSYSLDHANVEYAHAADPDGDGKGLTGAGQVISIVDAGYSTGHDELAGKTLHGTAGAAPNGGLSDPSHGTTVAGVAAGAAGSGQSIGVAPGAALHLGYYTNNTATTLATQEAEALGAIVQNNSWGYPGVPASQSNFNAYFGNGSGATYMNALKSYAANGVIVFAASNNPSLSSADLVAALPKFAPSLEKSFIAAVNGVPVKSGGKIASVRLLSAKCLEAAAWCMVADGTVRGAQATGASDYAIVTGTSFAAPQVAGAVALLAEAFPTLTAQELRARLLASANNKFYKHSGYVQFAPGVRHGFDNRLGHGFLDLKAALLPIGGSFMPMDAETPLPLDQPVVLGGGMAGNALSARLAQRQIQIVDGLGAGFSAPASILVAEPPAAENPLALTGTLLAADLSGDTADPFRRWGEFTAYVPGTELELALNRTDVTVLMPGETVGTGNYGLSVTQNIRLASSDLRVGFAAMREGQGFVGMQSGQSGAPLHSDHAAATLELAMPVAPGRTFSVSGALGVARPGGDLPALSMGQVRYNAVNAAYSAGDVWRGDDRLSLAVGLPHAVQAGRTTVSLPSTRAAGGFETIDVPLSPAARQIDLTVGYGMPLTGGNEDLLLSATHSLNFGNQAGQTSTSLAVALRVEF